MEKALRKNQDSAHQAIAAAMVPILGAWFIPVVSGLACNLAEKSLIGRVLRTMGRKGSDQEVGEVFWFVRKKMLLFNAGTYIPFAGTALQVMEVYAMGQFAILCSRLENLSEHEMQCAWAGIEQRMLSGRNLIAFYEGCSGKSFPENIRLPFETSIDELSRGYRGLMSVPGLQAGQEILGEGLRRTIKVASFAISFIAKKVMATRNL